MTPEEELIDTITTELKKCAGLFTITDGDLLVDDEDYMSVTKTIQFNPYQTDDGLVVPPEVTLQFDFDKNDGEWCLIQGEDTQVSITCARLFAVMYFYTLQDLLTK